jgi:two-component system cell cycle response regulator CtrA
MPKGSKLRELWADPEWRAQRLKDLRENRKWIEARSKMLTDEELRLRVVDRRKRRAIGKNYDLERENATLWWLLGRKAPVGRPGGPTSHREPKNRPSVPVNLPAGPYIQRIEELEETITSMKEALGTDRELLALRLVGLTEYQARLAAALYRREYLSKEGGLAAMYHDDIDRRMDAEPQIVDVTVCTVRKKLKHCGITIDTIWGDGYRMPPESKAKLKALMDRQFLKQAAE